MKTLTDAMRQVDADDDVAQRTAEILAVTEDFAEYVARRGRGITVATPARRALRETIEKIVLSFVQNAAEPSALDERAEARVQEIVDQTLRDRKIETTVVGSYPRDAIDAG